MSNPAISTLISKRHVIWWVRPILQDSRPLPSDRSTCFLKLSQHSFLPIFFVLAFGDLATPGRPCGQASQPEPWHAPSSEFSNHWTTDSCTHSTTLMPSIPRPCKALTHKIQQSITMQEQDCKTNLLAKCDRITRAGIIVTHRKHILLLAYKILVTQYKMLSLFGNLVAISRLLYFPACMWHVWSVPGSLQSSPPFLCSCSDSLAFLSHFLWWHHGGKSR